MKKLTLSLLASILMLALCMGGALAQETPDLKDDFYASVNAQWLAETEIPADSVVVDSFSELGDKVSQVLKADFEAMLNGTMPVDESLTDFIELYRMLLDYDTRDALGAEPLKPYMERIESLESLQDYAGQWLDLHADGFSGPFVLSVSADMGDASHNALYLSMPSAFLNAKEYYADENMRTALQGLYGQMAANLLMLAGKTQEEAQQIAADAIAFDELLSAYFPSATAASDFASNYNPRSIEEVDALLAPFDLAGSLQTMMDEVPQTIVVMHPDYVNAFSSLVNEETFPQMRSWLLVRMVCNSAPYLSDAMRTEASAFGRALIGQAEATPKEDSAYTLASMVFGEPIGIYYGKTYFGDKARADVTSMVNAFVSVYRNRLANNEWLSEETREMAIRKLDTMTINVGYPDQAHPHYATLHTVPTSEGGTTLGNIIAFTHSSFEYVLSHFADPVDRSEWPLSAHTVNAMYAPTSNSINFPAAILQAPYYSTEQSISANYGGIGAVIAHEISHAFDPNGSKFDENGSLANWWTQEDLETFSALSQAMVEEFDGLSCDGATVNGLLTVTENVADAGGLSCSLEALKQEEGADLEAFFTNWATIWRSKSTPEYAAMAATMDVHAPSKLRANIQLQNIDEFYTTFGITEGDGMYRAPEDRVSIW